MSFSKSKVERFPNSTGGTGMRTLSSRPQNLPMGTDATGTFKSFSLSYPATPTLESQPGRNDSGRSTKSNPLGAKKKVPLKRLSPKGTRPRAGSGIQGSPLQHKSFQTPNSIKNEFRRAWVPRTRSSMKAAIVKDFEVKTPSTKLSNDSMSSPRQSNKSAYLGRSGIPRRARDVRTCTTIRNMSNDLEDKTTDEDKVMNDSSPTLLLGQTRKLTLAPQETASLPYSSSLNESPCTEPSKPELGEQRSLIQELADAVERMNINESEDMSRREAQAILSEDESSKDDTESDVKITPKPSCPSNSPIPFYSSVNAVDDLDDLVMIDREETTDFRPENEDCSVYRNQYHSSSAPPPTPLQDYIVNTPEAVNVAHAEALVRALSEDKESCINESEDQHTSDAPKKPETDLLKPEAQLGTDDSTTVTTRRKSLQRKDDAYDFPRSRVLSPSLDLDLSSGHQMPQLHSGLLLGIRPPGVMNGNFKRIPLSMIIAQQLQPQAGSSWSPNIQRPSRVVELLWDGDVLTVEPVQSTRVDNSFISWLLNMFVAAVFVWKRRFSRLT